AVDDNRDVHVGQIDLADVVEVAGQGAVVVRRRAARGEGDQGVRGPADAEVLDERHALDADVDEGVGRVGHDVEALADVWHLHLDATEGGRRVVAAEEVQVGHG